MATVKKFVLIAEYANGEKRDMSGVPLARDWQQLQDDADFAKDFREKSENKRYLPVKLYLQEQEVTTTIIKEEIIEL